MKKYIIFISSLALLYIGYQILSGWILTAVYVPDISAIHSNVSGEAVFRVSPAIQLLAMLFIATLAYFVSQKLPLTPNK